MINNNETTVNKIRGALYGFCIGDSLGATTEFMSADEIKQQYGQVTDIIGGGVFNWNAGDPTDDTDMMLCVMRAIQSNSSTKANFLDELGKQFISWNNTNPKDIGNACYSVIEVADQNNVYGCNWDLLSLKIQKQYKREFLGNGSLMRALPLTFVELVCDYNLAQSKMTHNNECVDNVIIKYHNVMTKLLCDVRSNEDVKKEFAHLKLMDPEGHVNNTFNNVMYYAANANDYASGVLQAVNNGGDADTIAAITGSVLGMMYGFESIPQHWFNKLNKDTVQQVEKFINYLLNNALQI